MSDLINQLELAKALGVSRLTVAAWSKRGMPTLRGPSKTLRFDLKEVRAWMRSNSTSRPIKGGDE